MRSASRDCAPLYPAAPSRRTILNGLLAVLTTMTFGFVRALDPKSEVSRHHRILVMHSAERFYSATVALLAGALIRLAGTEAEASLGGSLVGTVIREISTWLVVFLFFPAWTATYDGWRTMRKVLLRRLQLYAPEHYKIQTLLDPRVTHHDNLWLPLSGGKWMTIDGFIHEGPPPASPPPPPPPSPGA